MEEIKIKSPEEAEAEINAFAEELTGELDDVELDKTKVIYEVWALGYDEDMNATDFEYFLDGDYTEVVEAQKCFDYFKSENTLTAYLENKNVKIPADTKHIHLMLEMCTLLEDGGTECQDVLDEAEIY